MEVRKRSKRQVGVVTKIQSKLPFTVFSKICVSFFIVEVGDNNDVEDCKVPVLLKAAMLTKGMSGISNSSDENSAEESGGPTCLK